MKKILVLASCLILVLAGAAQAEYFRFLPGTYPAAKIIDPGNSPNGETVGVGLYDFRFGPLGSPTMYQGFCVDWADVTVGAVLDSYFKISVPNLAPYKEAAWIFDNYSSFLSGKGATYPNAIAQLAIWEVVFEQLSGGIVKQTDGTGAQADKGVFYVKEYLDMTAADLVLANDLALAALGHSGYDTSAFSLLVSPEESNDYTKFYGIEWQDVMVKTPVPEPGTLLMFGLGLLGLAAIRRKK